MLALFNKNINLIKTKTGLSLLPAASSSGVAVGARFVLIIHSTKLNKSARARPYRTPQIRLSVLFVLCASRATFLCRRLAMRLRRRNASTFWCTSPPAPWRLSSREDPSKSRWSFLFRTSESLSFFKSRYSRRATMTSRCCFLILSVPSAKPQESPQPRCTAGSGCMYGDACARR